MIPVSLKLSNFTSYGSNPPVLDFTKFKMAAISGQNGAGKSSLLDSITWCVWGTSRAGDSSDNLVHLGATEMSVEFEFSLDSHTYTIKRKRIKKGGGNTSLEFWSGTHNLTEGTIKATQQKIINTLHLTYETFTNSAFLRQGHADEFTTKGPSDRKRILADILGLDHYDKLEEKAKERSKDAQTKLSLLEYKLIEIEAELSQKEERQKNLTLIKLEGEKTQKEIKELELLIKEQEEKKQLIHSKLDSLKEQKDRYTGLKSELTDLKLQIELKEQSQKEYKTILEKKAEILKNYSQIEKLEQKKSGFELKRSELIKLKDEFVTVTDKLADRETKRTEAINQELLKIKVIDTENETYLSQLESLKKSKNICPTCGSEIGEKENKQLLEKNQKLLKENETKLKELNLKIEKFKSIVLPEVAIAADLEKQIKAVEISTIEYPAILQQLKELEIFQALYLKLAQAEASVKAHTESILELQKMLTKKEEELKKLSNFEEDLNLYQNKLTEVESKLLTQNNQKQELTEKLMELRSKFGEANTLVSRITQMEILFKEKQLEKEKLTKEKDTFEELSLAFGKKGIQAMIIEAAIPEIEDEANLLLEKLTEGRMKIRLETQKETKTKVAQIDGTKDHSLVETLDIVISDEMGERPYELYSGGETFRVNFAIRLAISKLLSNRAGAKLQLLIIDEGFGTQDQAGKTRLVEIMDTIKNDFEKILIITHLEELKDEFPSRIEVQKGPNGSTFAVYGG